MPFLKVKDYKPSARKGTASGSKSFTQNLGGMPIGLLLAITYSDSQSIGYGGASDISIAGRIIQNTINIRVKTD